METLTKEQRREIYLKALKIVTSHGAMPVCVALKRAADFTHDVGRLTETACELFPEFATFKPERTLFLWFHTNDQRIECLKKCAEMCKD